jgi:hypothetical protein
MGQNCSTKFRMLKNSSELRSSSTLSGSMKSTGGGAAGAGCPRNAESV